MTSFSLFSSFSGKVEWDVGEEVEAPLVVLLEEGGLYAGLLLGGEGVEVATHVVEATQDVVGLAALSAFEDCMFHEVG